MNPEDQYQLDCLEVEFRSRFHAPDRRPLHEWGKDNISIPHSARSTGFDPDVAPWLKKPMEWSTDSETRELSVVGTVQGSKTTLAELLIPYILSNDPGPIMFNADTDPVAHDWSESRMYPVLRKSKATREHMKTLNRTQTGKETLKWLPGIHVKFQGAHAKSNLQGKSIKTLINDEAWLFPDGHLAEAYKRTTAFWDYFILNLATGGEIGGELHDRCDMSQTYFFHIECPLCGSMFYPRWTPPKNYKETGEAGGMRWDKSFRSNTGKWDYVGLRDTIYYSAPCCGGEIFDTPSNRRIMAQGGDYVLENEGMPAERKYAHYNGIAVYWVPFHIMVEEFLRGMFALRYGDEVLFKEFVQKRLAEFWDPDRHRPIIRGVKVEPLLSLKAGLKGADFRGGSIDRQYGHYWLLIRDWSKDNGCLLVHYEKVETDDDCSKIFSDYEVDPRMVLCDVANDQTKGLRICAKHGWTAVHGSPRKSFHHKDEEVSRIYSPMQFMDPFIGTREQNTQEVAMFYFAKHTAMDRITALRDGDVDYEWRVPGDVDDEYYTQMDSWERTHLTNSRTGAKEEVFKKIRKHDHIFFCELFQIILGSIMGLIGSERLETEDD